MTDVASEFAYAVANHELSAYTPFRYPAPGGTETSEFGEIAISRESSYNGNLLVVAFWRAQPATSPLYDFPLGDESGYVIEGSATIAFPDSDQSVHLHAGDLYTFRKNTLSRWTIHEPFTKFVVVNDGPAPASA